MKIYFSFILRINARINPNGLQNDGVRLSPSRDGLITFCHLVLLGALEWFPQCHDRLHLICPTSIKAAIVCCRVELDTFCQLPPPKCNNVLSYCGNK
jgi:hypothetical protein